MTNDTTEQLSDLGTPKLLLRLWHRIHPRRRKQIVVASLLMVVSAFAEMVTLGAVIPFVAVLVDPDRVLQYELVADLAQFLGVNQPEELVLPLAVLFVVGVLIAVVIRLAVVWSTTRLAMAIGADLSADAYERTLYQPYSTHIGRNTSEIMSGVIQKVEAIAGGILSPLQTTVGSALTIIAVMVALILIDPFLALTAVVSIGGGYVVITYAFRGRLKRNSQQITREQTRVVKAIQEGVGGIRDILIDGTQAVFLDQFRNSDRPVRRAQGSNSIIQQVPRVVLEGVAILVFSVLAVQLSGRPGGVASELPVLGALVLGGQRLLPLGQQCYAAATLVLGHRSHLAGALEILEQSMPENHGQPSPLAMKFETEIEFQHLRFRYTENGPWVIDDLNLTIRIGTRVGLVGTTGCGKSTLLDLLMGLLVPCQGAVLVDGQRLEGNGLTVWQRSIAHVPQHVFLADASLTENIAFGVRAEDIDLDRVMEAAHRAMIAEFIENEPMGYETVVGERGVRLSGGQRQRIGIARALYKKASVLVFDEATSALDDQTERAVIHSLTSLDRQATLLFVAHRLSTLRDCDVVIEMSDGRIVGQGTYEDLISTSMTFRELALAAESDA